MFLLAPLSPTAETHEGVRGLRGLCMPGGPFLGTWRALSGWRPVLQSWGSLLLSVMHSSLLFLRGY